MKNYLLILAAAGMLAAPAMAQGSHLTPVGVSRLTQPKGLKYLNGGNLQLPLTRIEGAQLMKTPQPFAASSRSPKELSFQVDGTEIDDAGLLTMGLTYSKLAQYGATGYGFASYFPSDMVSRYAGNTISKIHFACWMGNYSGVKAVVMDGDLNILWSKDLATVNKWSDSGAANDNVVDCDYTITGKEGGLLIGWMAQQVTADKNDPYAQQYGIIMPTYDDNTQRGAGAYVLGVTSSGQYGVLTSNAEAKDNAGNTIYVSAYVFAETTGDKGLLNLDASPTSATDVRADMQTNDGNSSTVALVNEGLDPITSFDYTFVSDGQTKEGTYTFDTPLKFYSVGRAQLEAQLAKQAGGNPSTFTITKVNNAADEYTDNKDNVVEHTVYTMNGKYARTPVVEQFTSTYCGWCPRGHVGMENLHKQYGDNIVLIAAHDNLFGENDPFITPEYTKIVDGLGVSSNPDAMVNRMYEGDPYFDTPAMIELLQKSFCEANMVVNATKSANPLSAKISVTTKVDFKLPVKDKNYGLFYVVTEDGITGVNQLNYFATYYQMYKQQLGYSDTQIYNAMGLTNYPDLQALCKESTGGDLNTGYVYQPTFDFVACSASDLMGETNLLPAVAEGEVYTASTTLNIPTRKTPAINNDNLKLAVMLVDQTSGQIVTGRQVQLNGEDSTPSSIDDATTKGTAQITVADGAFVVKAAKAEAQVFSADGKLISSATVQGEASLPTFGKGVYVIRVVENGHMTTQKAVF